MADRKPVFQWSGRIEPIHWSVHAPTTLAAVQPADYHGPRRAILAECSGLGEPIDFSISSARRLAACWNALVGVSTEDIEQAGAAHAVGPLLLTLLRATRDAVAVLRNFAPAPDEITLLIAQLDAVLENVGTERAAALARAAIDFAKGGAR